MKNIITLAGILLLGISNFQAQSIDHAYLMSADELIGTSRFVAMGGAFTAFGANQTAISYNPAAIALYRRNEASMSFSVNDMYSTSTYMGNNAENGNAIFAFDNFGFVASSNYDDTYVRGNMGVMYNKLANFNESYTISGQVEGTTLLDVFVAQANGTHADDVGTTFYESAGLAYNTYLINPYDDDLTQYYSEIPSGELTQTKTVDRTGRKGETLIAGGANVDNRVYFGFSLGFPSFHMEENSQHTESDLDPSLELDQFTFKEKLILDANGFNMKGGIILQATEWLRLGGSYQSPSWMAVSGVYSREMTSLFKDGDSYQDQSDPVNYVYNFRTPAKYNINTGIIIGKNALIGADYEFVNYNAMKFSDPNDPLTDVDYSQENKAVKSAFKATHNFRVGGEVRILKDYAVRAGFNYKKDPYEEGVTESSGEIMTYTAGLGYRRQSFYVDVAYALSQANQDHYLYNPQLVSAATIASDTNQMILTVGYRY